MFGFLHPWLLAGLAAAGVPLLLHLLARRQPPTVPFPAVRYLVDTTQEHRHRLRLQHWLLLVLRTLLIALLVLAAAGPIAPFAGGGHAPASLALVLDNSASSGTMVGGTPRLAALKSAARRVLDHASPDDHLWLITADGVPVRGDAVSLRGVVDSLPVVGQRLDLGAAVTAADQVISESGRPGSIVVLSDLQQSALSAARPRTPVVVARAGAAPPRNHGIAAIGLGLQPWSTDGGRVTVRLTGDSAAAMPVSVASQGSIRREAVPTAGGTAAVAVNGGTPGWHVVTTELEPDEFRLDDRRVAAVRVAPVARAQWDTADRYIAAAAAVLTANGRLARGSDVSLGTLGGGASVVMPPSDPALIGALNRRLAARGVTWRFGDLVERPEVADSGRLVGRVKVQRRLTLEPSTAGSRTGVLATVGGDPWIVRSGNVILIGSRLDPEWTGLPVSAGFVPFLDALLNRTARGDLDLLEGVPGAPVLLPDAVKEIREGDRQWPVEGGAAYRPPELGVYYLLSGADTIGALSVNLDPRESELAPADDDAVRHLWPGSRVVDQDRIAAAAFATTARSDLRGPLLWAALLAAFAEVALASFWRRNR
ncbi:MAG TPA: BatA and WFA domain-containing protein [Gemmatimonadales bacterium]|nr:BatA and WFA domain-containing protein [Gemmatimonadales bacterium]